VSEVGVSTADDSAFGSSGLTSIDVPHYTSHLVGTSRTNTTTSNGKVVWPPVLFKYFHYVVTIKAQPTVPRREQPK
jgi:hypothetical protein